MQAFLDGHKVEANNGDGWVECVRPLWDWAVWDYRVKPTPRIIWKAEKLADGTLVGHYKDPSQVTNPEYRAVKFVEVIEE